MIEYDIKRLVPRFMLKDRDGYAMSMAIKAGMDDFLAICQRAVDTWNNPEEMPEWRLDEMAWEYNIPYDYDAEESIKRAGVSRARALSRLYGAAEGLKKYMDGVLSDCEIEEWQTYAGDPYHFRIKSSSMRGMGYADWATRAIEAVKNVRSVLDSLSFESNITQHLYTGHAIYGMTTGQYRTETDGAEDIACYTDEDGALLIDEGRYPLIAEDDEE